MSTPVVQLAPSSNFVDVLSMDGAVTPPVKVTAPMVSENTTPEQFVPPIVSGPAVVVSIKSVFRPDTDDTVRPAAAVSSPETVKAPVIVERPTPVTLIGPLDERDVVAEMIVACSPFKTAVPAETLIPFDEFSPAAPTVPEAIKLTTFVAPEETVNPAEEVSPTAPIDPEAVNAATLVDPVEVSAGVETLVAVNACTLVAPETVADPATRRPPRAFTVWPRLPR